MIVNGNWTFDGSIWTLPAAITTTGTINNWAPAGLVGPSVILWSGASDATITGLVAGQTGQMVTFKNTGAGGNLFFKHQNAGSGAGNRFQNIATSGDTPVASGGRIVYVYDGSQWQLYEHEQGAWITRSFAAGNFTGNGSMTWTVAAVTTDAYHLGGKTLTYGASIAGTTVGGTPNTNLQIAIPAGFVATRQIIVPSRIQDGGAWSTGIAFCVASGTTIAIAHSDNVTNWTTSASTSLGFETSFEVN